MYWLVGVGVTLEMSLTYVSVKRSSPSAIHRGIEGIIGVSLKIFDLGRVNNNVYREIFEESTLSIRKVKLQRLCYKREEKIKIN